MFKKKAEVGVSNSTNEPEKLPSLPSKQSDATIKSVGASISPASEKPQQAKLNPPKSVAIDPEPKPTDSISARTSVATTESPSSPSVPKSDVIVKKIERNPNSRRISQPTAATEPVAPGGIQRVERRVANTRHAAVTVVNVADGVTNPRSSIIGPLPDPAVQEKKIQQLKEEKRLAESHEGASPGSKVRFDMDGTTAAAAAASTSVTNKTGDGPTSILRKSVGATGTTLDGSEPSSVSPRISFQEPLVEPASSPKSKPPTKTASNKLPAKSAKESTDDKDKVEKGDKAEKPEKSVPKDPSTSPSKIPRTRSQTEIPEAISSTTESTPKTATKDSKLPNKASALTPGKKSDSQGSLITVSKKKLIPIDKPGLAKDTKEKGVADLPTKEKDTKAAVSKAEAKPAANPVKEAKKEEKSETEKDSKKGKDAKPVATTETKDTKAKSKEAPASKATAKPEGTNAAKPRSQKDTPKPKPGGSTANSKEKLKGTPGASGSKDLLKVADKSGEGVETPKRQKSLSEPPTQKAGKLAKLGPDEGKPASIDELKKSNQNLLSPVKVSRTNLSKTGSKSVLNSSTNIAESKRLSSVNINAETSRSNSINKPLAAKSLSKDNIVKQSTSSLNDESKGMTKSKSNSKLDLAAAAKTPKSISTSERPGTKPGTSKKASEKVPSDPSNSRLQRTLKLRASLKLDVDGVFAMGLAAPVEDDLSPPTDLPKELLEPEKPADTKPYVEEEPETPAIPAVSSPLPLKRHPSARRTVMKAIGYPATGWSAEKFDEKETDTPMPQYRFRRAKSLEDATRVYSEYRETHPLPFGHHGTFSEYRAVRGDNVETESQAKTNPHQTYEDAMMESFGFTVPPAPPATPNHKRPTTVPIPTPQRPGTTIIAANKLAPRKLQSAQELKSVMGTTAIPPLPPLAKPPASLGSQVAPPPSIAENSVKYLEQYINRAKKAGREPPTVILQNQMRNVGVAAGAGGGVPTLDSFPRRPAPPPILRKPGKSSDRDGVRNRQASEPRGGASGAGEDWERYSNIVQRRTGWEPGVSYLDDEEEENRGRSRSRRRENTPADFGERAKSEPRIKSLERGLATRESMRPVPVSNGLYEEEPFGFEDVGQPLDWSQSKKAGAQKSAGKSIMSKPKSKANSPKVARKSKGMIATSSLKGKPLKRIELEPEPQAMPSNFQSQAQFTMPWLNNQMGMMGIQPNGMFPQNFPMYLQDPHQQQASQLQLQQQLIQNHFPWFSSFNAFPPHQHFQAPPSKQHQEGSEAPAKSVSTKPKAKDSKLNSVKSAKKSNAKASTKSTQKQTTTSTTTDRGPKPPRPPTALPTYNSMYTNQLPQMMSPQPFVPPTLMPARIRVQNVPVVMLQQAMVIEPTGEPPGSYGTEMGQPTFMSSAFAAWNRGLEEAMPPPVVEEVVEEVKEVEKKGKKGVKIREKSRGRSGVRSMIAKGIIGRHKGGD
ncbi:hypothetical protein BCR33DRAFT_852726 [Rhizoclosmatium globosum]|uniref:Uncharacterized protein n=1 Tax=Rhizoclosmatium globosum TaxID=329046 RepID=A0A1Y2C024_9FUNG|nr:hypothetical protein BCR33DRAFT_852726 [Rhizoclosmatium globosum]|eukprot:ORY40393.1 hypothetical protein BCR33DRAFT_852726 [Rhizoclosmatium globosum]